MRNLKRALSLAMAAAMLLGMMVIGAGATSYNDFTDKDEITHQEAVALMVDLGIINGKGDGSKYDPKGTLERSEMAKMAFYAYTGETDASAYVGVNSDFSDVKGAWAEGYINYCVGAGFISGTSAPVKDANGKLVTPGTFSPASKLTVAAAAKVLLTALGYDAADRGYVGDTFALSVMRDARANNLLDGIEQSANDYITRDNAAQMLYNALFANMREATYDRDMGEKYVSGYTVLPYTMGLKAYGLAKVTATVGDVTASNVDLKGTAVLPASKDDVARDAAVVAAKGAASGFKFTTDMVGTSIVFYTKNTYTTDKDGNVTLAYKGLYSKAAMPAATTVLGTVTYGLLKAPIDMFANATTKGVPGFVAELEAEPAGNNQPASVTYYLNGASKSVASPYGIGTADKRAAGTGADGAVKTATTDIQAQMVAGAIVEFIDSNANGKADIVKVTRKTAATLTGDVATKTVGDTTQIRIPGVINSFSSVNTTDTVVGYEGLKKGDVVLYVKLGDTTYIEKATSIEGKVTAKNSLNQVRVEDNYYSTSGLTGLGAASFNGATFADYGNTYTFYLDNGNNIMKAVAVTSEASTNYAVVLKNGWAGSTTEIGGNSYAQAQLLYTDGTTEVVKVSKLNGNSVTYNGAVKYTDITPNVFYTYTEDGKGGYDLTAASAGVKLNDDAYDKITTGNVAFDGKTIGNADTIFLVKSGTSYKAYTGIANVATMTYTPANTDVIMGSGNVASLVYINGATIAGDAGEYFFVPSTTLVNYYPGRTPYYELAAVIDGETVNIKLKATNSNFSTDWSAIIAGGLYKVTSKDANGIITVLAETNKNYLATNAVEGINVAAGGTLSVGASDTLKVYSYDSDTKVYYINEANELSVIDYSALAADASDKVLVLSADTKYADVVYVKEVNNSGVNVTFTASLNGDNIAGKNVDSTGSNVTLATDATETTAKTLRIAATPKASADKGFSIVVTPASQTLVNSDTSYEFAVTVTSEDSTVSQSYTVTVTLTSVTIS